MADLVKQSKLDLPDGFEDKHVFDMAERRVVNIGQMRRNNADWRSYPTNFPRRREPTASSGMEAHLRGTVERPGSKTREPRLKDVFNRVKVYYDE